MKAFFRKVFFADTLMGLELAVAVANKDVDESLKNELKSIRGIATINDKSCRR